MIYRIIDQNGVFLRDDFSCNEDEIALDVEPSQGFYLPKWDGTQWIEAGIPPTPTPTEPTQEERLQALEGAMLEMILGGAV